MSHPQQFKEIEARWINVDADEMIKRLGKIGAKKVGEFFFREWIFAHDDWVKDNRRIRVRTDGITTWLTYKSNATWAVDSTEEKGQGPNPGLTETGKQQIKALPIPNGITQMVVGTGRRFIDVFCIVKPQIGDVPVKFSLLCGSADSGEKSETGFRVALADGTVVEIGDYLGLIGTTGIDLTKWISSLPNNTLLCAGRELLGGLGYAGEPGHLYSFDGKTVAKIA